MRSRSSWFLWLSSRDTKSAAVVVVVVVVVVVGRGTFDVNINDVVDLFRSLVLLVHDFVIVVDEDDVVGGVHACE